MADYNAMKVPELRKHLGDRKLPQSGNKADLIARLQEDDNKATSTSAPAAPAEDEIDWDEDETATKPAATATATAEATAPATTAPAAAAVAAGGQGPIDTPVNVPNQKQDIDPAETHDLKVAAVGANPDEKATSAAPETATSAEPEVPKQDFTAGVALTDAEKEAKRRAERIKKWGVIELTEEEKKLKARAEKFGTAASADIDEATIKAINEGLPERKKRERKEQGGRAAKRQTPDRSQGQVKTKNEKKPPMPAKQQQNKPQPQQKKAISVLDDPVEKAKAEARAKRWAAQS